MLYGEAKPAGLKAAATTAFFGFGAGLEHAHAEKPIRQDGGATRWIHLRGQFEDAEQVQGWMPGVSGPGWELFAGSMRTHNRK